MYQSIYQSPKTKHLSALSDSIDNSWPALDPLPPQMPGEADRLLKMPDTDRTAGGATARVRRYVTGVILLMSVVLVRS